MCIKCGNDMFCYCGQHNEKVQNSKLNDGLSNLVKKWEKDLKKYGTRIDEEANKANHDGVTALAIMRSELRGRLKELRQAG